MPKNYLEQLLLNLESITDKNEIIAFLKKSKPYHEMDNADYLAQIINAINDYIHTYKELEKIQCKDLFHRNDIGKKDM